MNPLQEGWEWTKDGETAISAFFLMPAIQIEEGSYLYFPESVLFQNQYI